MYLKNTSLITLLAVGAITFNTSSCKEDKKEVIQTKVTFKKEGELSLFKSTSDTLIAKFDIEIAETEYETQTGLMYRDAMDNNHGMLFIFPDSKQRSFYMKNTKIPLDIIYLNTNKAIVSISKNTKPFNENSLPSNGAAQYVLELNAGLSDELGLKIGDTFSYTRID